MVENLMIGDYFLFRKGLMKVDSAWNMVDVQMSEKDCKPVPITEKILLDNGFKEDKAAGFGYVYGEHKRGGVSYFVRVSKYVSTIHGEVWCLCWHWDSPSFTTGSAYDLYGIHEIQNILRSLRINKDITVKQEHLKKNKNGNDEKM